MMNTNVAETTERMSPEDLSREIDRLIGGDVRKMRTALDLLLGQAVLYRASDIHVEPYREKLRVRLRVDGYFRDVMTLEGDLQEQFISRVKVMSHLVVCCGKVVVEVVDVDVVDVVGGSVFDVVVLELVETVVVGGVSPQKSSAPADVTQTSGSTSHSDPGAHVPFAPILTEICPAFSAVTQRNRFENALTGSTQSLIVTWIGPS